MRWLIEEAWPGVKKGLLGDDAGAHAATVLHKGNGAGSR